MSTSSFFTGGESPTTNVYEDEAKVHADAAEASAQDAANSASAAATSADEAAAKALDADNAADAAVAAKNVAETKAAEAASSVAGINASATAAATSASQAANSANTAGTNAADAAISASTAAASATNAAGSATAAGSSASAAASSATSASSSATTATTKADEASSSAANAANSAAAAASSASGASTSAANAANSASAASTSASNASTSAANASTSASNAANSATAASGSATAASGSATAAASAQTAAESARDAALAAYDSFDDRYLGTKASDPTLDNDGNALVAGALYFNSTDGEMRVYTGSVWTAAYVSGTGVLLAANNLSDLADAATARANLGLGTAATTNASAYATAAQGAKADTAVQTIASADGSVSITGTTSIDLSVAVAGATSNVILPVRNTTGSTLTKGTAVYISGATGQTPTVTKAIATSDATSAQTLGLITADLANNANGNVTLIGAITGIDTSAYSDGQQLYLSPSTPGALTATKPYAPSHLVYLAVVEYAHPTQGKLFVKVQNGYEMDELHDVAAQSPANNDGLFYNTSTSLWEKKSIATALGFTPYNATNPAGYLSSVDLVSNVTGTLNVANGGTGATSLTSGYLIKGNGTSAVSASVVYDNGTNVGIGTTSPNQKLMVEAATGGTTARFRNTTAGNFIDFYETSGGTRQGYVGAISATDFAVWSDKAGYMAFATNNTERMRIASSGNIGVGATAPQGKMEIRTASGGTVTNALTLSNYVGSTVNTGVALYFDPNGAGSVARAASIQSVQATSGNFADLRFFTSNSDTPAERIRVTPAGNVGIGTGSPSSLLDVNGNAEVNGTLYLGSSNHGNLASDSNTLYARGTNIAFQNAAGSGTYAYINSSGDFGIGTTSLSNRFTVKGGTTWLQNFAGSASSPTETVDWPVPALNVTSYGDFTLQTMMTFTLPNDGNYFTGDSVWNFRLDQTASSTTSAGVNGMRFMGPGYLMFGPGTTEKARITSSGNWLVGTTSLAAGNWANEIKNTTTDAWPLALNATTRGMVVRNSSASSGYYAYFEYNGGTNNGSISWSGGTTAYNTTSDARIKDNIVDAPEAGDLIDDIKVRSWDFKADGAHWRYGMVAQELLEVAPEAVSVPEDPDMMMGVDYAKLVPMLIKEVQSLRARVAQLEGK